MPYNLKSKQNLIQNSLTEKEKKRRIDKAVKSASETKRIKRESKEICNILLSLPATGNVDKNLRELGLPEEDRTNLAALHARLFTMAMSGNLKAMELLFRYAGYDPEMIRKQRETAARTEAIMKGLDVRIGGEGESGGNDVIIVLPENNRKTFDPEKDIKENDNGAADADAPFSVSEDSSGE